MKHGGISRLISAKSKLDRLPQAACSFIWPNFTVFFGFSLANRSKFKTPKSWYHLIWPRTKRTCWTRVWLVLYENANKQIERARKKMHGKIIEPGCITELTVLKKSMAAKGKVSAHQAGELLANSGMLILHKNNELAVTDGRAQIGDRRYVTDLFRVTSMLLSASAFEHYPGGHSWGLWTKQPKPSWWNFWVCAGWTCCCFWRTQFRSTQVCACGLHKIDRHTWGLIWSLG